MAHLGSGKCRNYITIYVKNLLGKAITLNNIEMDDTIEILKEKLRDQQVMLTTESMRIIYAGKELGNGETVQGAGLSPDCVITLLIRDSNTGG